MKPILYMLFCYLLIITSDSSMEKKININTNELAIGYSCYDDM